jgi:hypothetical protein
MELTNESDPVAAAEAAPEAVGVPEGSVEETAATVHKIDTAGPQPAGRPDTAGTSLIKRVAPVLALIVMLLVVREVLKRRNA